MKKLFTISDGRSVFAREEGNVYELVDWKKKIGYFVMLMVNSYRVTNEKIVALLPDYDEIKLESKSTILAKKEGRVGIYDYYQT